MRLNFREDRFLIPLKAQSHWVLQSSKTPWCLAWYWAIKISIFLRSSLGVAIAKILTFLSFSSPLIFFMISYPIFLMDYIAYLSSSIFTISRLIKVWSWSIFLPYSSDIIFNLSNYFFIIAFSFYFDFSYTYNSVIFLTRCPFYWYIWANSYSLIFWSSADYFIFSILFFSSSFFKLADRFFASYSF